MGFFHWKDKSVDNIKPVNGFFHFGKKTILSLHEKVWKLEINPRKLGECWQKNKLFASSVIAVIFALIITIISSKGNASEINLYATKCLGGWQYIENATGAPDLKHGSDLADFNKNNSAILNQSASDLYCGGFAGEVPKNISPDKITLNISWAITDEKFIDEPQTIDTIIDSDDLIIQEEQAEEIEQIFIEEKSDTETDTKTEKKEVKEKTENKTEEKPEETKPDSSFLFFKRVRAQETEIPATPVENPPVNPPEETPTVVETQSKEVPPTEAQTVESNSNESSSSEILPEENAKEEKPKTEVKPEAKPELEKEEDSKKEENPIDDGLQIIEEIQSQIEHLVEEPEIVEEGFLEVLYSVDGVEWKHLGYVDRQNWQSASYVIDEKDLSWEKISSIQIELKSLQTFDEQPVIYLDSLWLTVSYEEIEEVEEEVVISADPKKLHAVNIQNSNSDFTVEMANDINQGEQFVFSALPNTNVRFYLSSDENFGFFMQIGSDANLLPTYNLVAGDFIAVNTKLETTCDTETVLECLNSPDFIGAINFSLISNLDNSSNETIDTIIETENLSDGIESVIIIESNPAEDSELKEVIQ